jgi:hypothetical protein
MNTRQPDRLAFWRIVLAFSSLLTIPSVVQIFGVTREQYASNVLISNWSPLIGLAVVLGVSAFIVLILILNPQHERILDRLEISSHLQGIWVVFPLGILIVSMIIFPVIMRDPYYGTLLDKPWIKVFIVWWLSLVGMVCLKLFSSRFNSAGALAVVLILQASISRIASSLPDISVSPFSLGWAEASRFYDASLFFSQKIYGAAVPWAVLHPSLHILLAIPFLVPGSPLWLHRVWQLFLRLGLTGALGVVFSRWLRIEDRTLRWFFALWAFIYLLQGPIYLHLIVPVIIVLLGFSENNLRRTFFIVVIASIWAGLSRINWFPVPALMAAALYFLRKPVHGDRPFRYLTIPLMWLFAGILAALASQWVYIYLSGNINNWRAFYSSTASALLWYRLWPNLTYPLGIIPAIGIVSAPLILIIYWKIRSKVGILHPLRLWGVIVELTILFAGGLIVSIKIGGGGDLHNLDAFIILLMLVAGTLFWDRQINEPDMPGYSVLFPWQTAAFAILVPVWFGIQSVHPVSVFSTAGTGKALAQIRSVVEQTAQNGGEVLFISQRQLLTFKDITAVPLVSEYEKDFLIEMVMAHNKPYLSKFYNDIRSHRFALIVADTQWYKYQEAGENWGEENNLWVKAVTEPLLCEYEQTRIPGVNVSLLMPRSTPTNCIYP